MAAPLDDFAVLQHHDGVGVAHGGQAVGDDEHGAALHQLIHALFDEGLGAGIDRAGGLVQDEHRRVGHGGPGDGQQLALALGQAGPVGGDQGIVALGQAADEGIRPGDGGGPLHLLLGGVQLAKADVVGDGAAEQVGILEHDAQGAAQIRLADVLEVDAVVGDAPLADLVEPVDQVGDGGLARAGGAHEGNLLPRLGVQGNALQDGLSRPVTKIYILKAHVALKGPALALGDYPIPAISLRIAFQAHLALVGLGGLVHGLEYPLRAGQGGQQKVALGGELVDGHGGLAHKYQITGQSAHIGQALEGHQPPQHRHQGVIAVGNAHHGGHHGGGIALGAHARLAQGLVAGFEAGQVLRLVVEHLDHLLSGYHLLNIAIELAQAGLLGGVVCLAPPAAVADIAEHGPIAQHHQQGQAPVEDEQQRQRANHLDKALDEHGKAVVQGVGDGIHVAGKVVHHVAVAAGVEKAQGQGLQVGEQIPPDVEEHLLGRPGHEPGIAQRAQGAQGVDAGGEGHALHQGLPVPLHQVVHHRANHVSAQQVGPGADCHQHRRRQQGQPVPAHIGQEPAQGAAQVLGPLIAKLPRHSPSLPSFGTPRFPDRWGPWPAGSRDRPRRVSGHCPG